MWPGEAGFPALTAYFPGRDHRFYATTLHRFHPRLADRPTNPPGILFYCSGSSTPSTSRASSESRTAASRSLAGSPEPPRLRSTGRS